MALLYPIRHTLPELDELETLAALPLVDCQPGPIYDRVEPDDANDHAFGHWDTPPGRHPHKRQPTRRPHFQGRKALHFAFESRDPQYVWQKGWNIWYDHALLLRDKPPADVVLTATLAMDEITTGYGADNVSFQRPWTGMVARMQDLRRYYYLCLEFPGRVVLYRRDDAQWIELAAAQVWLDTWTPYQLTLSIRGNAFEAWLGGQFLFHAVDYAYREGWAGLRATTTSFATDFRILRHPDRAGDAAGAKPRPCLAAGQVVGEIGLSDRPPISKTSRHNANIHPARLRPDAPDKQLMIRLFGGPDEPNWAAVDLDGKVLYKAHWPGADMLHVLPAGQEGTNDLIAVANEQMFLIDGRTGRIRKQAPAPDSPNTGQKPRAGNGPRGLADLDGDGVADTFFLTCGCNDRELWAVDFELNLRWYVQTLGGQGHGGHLSACDVNGDGIDEIAAGLCLIDAAGQILWQQEDVGRLLKCPNGHHIDSSVMGFFEGPDAPPRLHYAASSAGMISLDARTGRLLAVHPQGHVQFISTGRILPGRAEPCVIATNRWGSYGVTGVYDGSGRRVSRFQAGFVSQSTTPIRWTDDQVEHLLVCDGPGWRGIYDHRGNRLVDLDGLVPVADPFAGRFDRVNAKVGRFTRADRDEILIRCGSRIRIIAPA